METSSIEFCASMVFIGIVLSDANISLFFESKNSKKRKTNSQFHVNSSIKRNPTIFQVTCTEHVLYETCLVFFISHFSSDWIPGPNQESYFVVGCTWAWTFLTFGAVLRIVPKMWQWGESSNVFKTWYNTYDVSIFNKKKCSYYS